MSLHEIAAAGNRLATLRELRDDLARWLDECDSARDQASLSLRLMDVLAQIDEVEAAKPEQKGTALDELNARRAARVAGTKDRARA